VRVVRIVVLSRGHPVVAAPGRSWQGVHGGAANVVSFDRGEVEHQCRARHDGAAGPLGPLRPHAVWLGRQGRLRFITVTLE
ncbi:MAG: hypothetical protein M3Q37_00610, partial [Gemmatimonadota bacterium]|nr:hypothetical protein [Gemmatimonadota bacterium]